MALPTYLTTEAGDRLLTEAGGYLLGERSYPQYEGYNIFDLRANWAEEPSERFRRNTTVLENVTGRPLVRSHTTTPVGAFDILISLEGRDEIAEFRSWLSSLRGRHVPVWVPTWVADLTPTVDPSGTSLTVESVAYTARMYPANARKHLAIVAHDGTIYPRGVTGASDNGTTESLTISPTLGVTLAKEHTMISFLVLARLVEDEVEIDFYGHSYAEAKMSWVEVPREVPAP